MRAEYLKAAPYLNIVSSDRAFGKADAEEVEALRDRIAELEKIDETRVIETQNELKGELQKIERRVWPMLALLAHTREEIANGREPPKGSKEVEEWLEKWFGSPDELMAMVKKIDERRQRNTA